MKVLAIDTSRQCQSATIVDLTQDEVLATVVKYKLQSSSFITTLAMLFSLNKIELEGIDMLAVTTGPGSFTGIKTGLIICKTLASQLNLKIFTANNFALLRFEQKLADDQPVAILAGKNDYFVSMDSNYSDMETNFYTNTPNFEEYVLDFEEPNTSLVLSQYLVNKYQKLKESLFSLGTIKSSEELLPYYLREPSIGKKTVENINPCTTQAS